MPNTFYKTAILLAATLILGWPILAAAQYYVPQNKKDTSQSSDEKPKSFFNYYFSKKKAPAPVQEKETTIPKSSVVKITPQPSQKTPSINMADNLAEPIPYDPRNDQWMKEGQALNAKMASSSVMIGKDSNLVGGCSAEEAKAFDSIAGNFNQITQERNASNDKDSTSLNMARYLEKPGNADKVMYLYMKCGNRAKV